MQNQRCLSSLSTKTTDYATWAQGRLLLLLSGSHLIFWQVPCRIFWRTNEPPFIQSLPLTWGVGTQQQTCNYHLAPSSLLALIHDSVNIWKRPWDYLFPIPRLENSNLSIDKMYLKGCACDYNLESIDYGIRNNNLPTRILTFHGLTVVGIVLSCPVRVGGVFLNSSVSVSEFFLP